MTTIALGAISSCQPQTSNRETSTSNQTDCRTIEHEAGETEVCGQPQRIVVLGSNSLETLLSLNVQPVAFADIAALHQGDYDQPSQQIPYLGDRIEQSIANVGTASNPSIEAIAGVQPDLIIGSSSLNSQQYETFSQISPTLLLEWTETETNLKAIAQAVNRTPQAEQLLEETEQKIAAAREAFTALTEPYPQVALITTSNLQEMWINTKADGLCASLIEELGFQLVFPPGLNSNDASSSAPLSLEILPQLNNADLVILLGYNFSDLKQLQSMDRFENHQLSKLKQAWEENAIAQSLDASQAGRVYFLTTYLCRGLPGPIGTELFLEELKQQLLTDPS
ncbi:MAG: iron-siderophore ABC transporter substrate-binding protein [Cyanobacteria bacterium P01_D01_bin.56]